MTQYSDLENLLDLMKISGEADFEKDAVLAKRSSFRIGGCADFAVFPKTKEALAKLAFELDGMGIRHRIFGYASNVLFDDAGFRGVAIFTDCLKSVTVRDDEIECDCGVGMTHLSLVAQNNSLSGIEFLYGIPGTIGGGIAMNAGAYGSELCSVAKTVTVYDRKCAKIKEIAAHDCGFSYRDSIFLRGDYVVLSCVLKLHRGDGELIKAQMDDFMERRRSKQPLEYPSAGSVFKRYPGHFTGKLIEDAGLKGRTIGGAQVSEKHAGFIVNRGGATSRDVLDLIDAVKEEVKRINGFEIECEIRYISPF